MTLKPLIDLSNLDGITLFIALTLAKRDLYRWKDPLNIGLGDFPPEDPRAVAIMDAVTNITDMPEFWISVGYWIAKMHKEEFNEVNLSESPD